MGWGAFADRAVQRLGGVFRLASNLRSRVQEITMRMIGIILIVLGLVGLIWGGISWTTQETVVDLGPLEVNQEQRETLPLPPIAGAVLVLAGAAVLIGARK
jgi:uncharacterized membrane protein YidH (DUF202 family)